MIRKATKLDQENIRDLYLRAFSEDENEIVAALASRLLNEETTPPTLSLVADIDGNIGGHIAFTPVGFDTDKNLTGYILAPLAVKPEYRKQRIGSNLIKNGIEEAKKNGVDIIFVYGDPAYYGRFGFQAQTAVSYIPPYELEYPFGWTAIALNKIVSDNGPIKLSCVTPLRDPALW